MAAGSSLKDDEYKILCGSQYEGVKEKYLKLKHQKDANCSKEVCVMQGSTSAFVRDKLIEFDSHGHGKYTWSKEHSRIRPYGTITFLNYCERHTKPKNPLKGPDKTRANNCSSYVSHSFHPLGQDVFVCVQRHNSIHCGHDLNDISNKKVSHIDDDVKCTILFMHDHGASMRDIFLKLSREAETEGYVAEDRSRIPTTRDIRYIIDAHKRNTFRCHTEDAVSARGQKVTYAIRGGPASTVAAGCGGVRKMKCAPSTQPARLHIPGMAHPRGPSPKRMKSEQVVLESVSNVHVEEVDASGSAEEKVDEDDEGVVEQQIIQTVHIYMSGAGSAGNSCVICGEAFQRPSLLNQHMRAVHTEAEKMETLAQLQSHTAQLTGAAAADTVAASAGDPAAADDDEARPTYVQYDPITGEASVVKIAYQVRPRIPMPKASATNYMVDLEELKHVIRTHKFTKTTLVEFLRMNHGSEGRKGEIEELIEILRIEGCELEKLSDEPRSLFAMLTRGECAGISQGLKDVGKDIPIDSMRDAIRERLDEQFDPQDIQKIESGISLAMQAMENFPDEDMESYSNVTNTLGPHILRHYATVFKTICEGISTP